VMRSKAVTWCTVLGFENPASQPSHPGFKRSDAFLGLMRTTAKLGITFWDYLGDRLSISG
jgi:hypothetical protein